MKRKILSLLTLTLILSASLFTLTACGGGGDPHVHAYTETTVGATCTQEGYTKHECSCGDTYNDTFVSKLTHSLNANGECSTCTATASEGLRITKLSGKDEYSLKGIGTYIGTEVIIPSSVSDCPVTDINSSAFKNKEIEAIYIPSTVKNIGKQAFYGCTSLKKVIFYGDDASQIEAIGNEAFYECSNLTTVAFGQGCQLSSLGDFVFNGCDALELTELNGGLYLLSGNAPLVFMGIKDDSATSLTIADGTRIIYQNAADRNDNLVEVSLPNSIKQICSEAFYESVNIKTVTFSGTYNEWAVINFADSYSPHYYSRGVITEELDKKSVTLSAEKISDYAFNNFINIESLTLANSVKSVGEKAFVNCYRIRELKIGSGLESVGDKAFEGCTKIFEICNDSALMLTAGSVDNGYVSAYAKNIYSSKKGKSKYVLSNDFYTFNDGTNNLLIDYVGEGQVVTIPSNVQRVENYALYNKSFITQLNITEGVKEIGDYAFAGLNQITEITLPDSLQKIGNNSFDGCSKAEVINFSKTRTLETIGDYAFANCSSLTEAILPDGLKKTGNYSFNLCSNLLLFSMPASLEEVSWYMVNGCYKCTELWFRGIEGKNEKGVGFTEMLKPHGKLWWNWYYQCGTSIVKYPKANGVEYIEYDFEGAHGRG